MRPIDADAYAAELWKMRQNYQMLDDTHTADKIMHGLYRAEQALKDAPTIDAVPVVHGEWKQHKKGGIYCSACKHDNHCGDVRLIMGYVQKFPICPWCGAKMDKKENDK